MSKMMVEMWWFIVVMCCEIDLIFLFYLDGEDIWLLIGFSWMFISLIYYWIVCLVRLLKVVE